MIFNEATDATCKTVNILTFDSSQVETQTGSTQTQTAGLTLLTCLEDV